jgi:hypothetical protein
MKSNKQQRIHQTNVSSIPSYDVPQRGAHQSWLLVLPFVLIQGLKVVLVPQHHDVRAGVRPGDGVEVTLAQVERDHIAATLELTNWVFGGWDGPEPDSGCPGRRSFPGCSGSAFRFQQ